MNMIKIMREMNMNKFFNNRNLDDCDISNKKADMWVGIKKKDDVNIVMSFNETELDNKCIDENKEKSEIIDEIYDKIYMCLKNQYVETTVIKENGDTDLRYVRADEYDK